MAYEVRISETAAKAIAAMHPNVVERIKQKILALATNPTPAGVVKLQGEDAYRIRVGDYRIVYSIDHGQLIVWIIRVAHRREVYRRRKK